MGIHHERTGATLRSFLPYQGLKEACLLWLQGDENL
jgi:hypothetical protein